MIARHVAPVARKRVRKTADERRTEILVVAGPHFARHGYRATDVQDIADAIGIGKGTIYRFFATKEALFLAVVERAVEDLKVFINGGVEPLSDPLDKVRTGIVRYLEFFDRHPDVVELFIQERAEFGGRAKPAYFVHEERDRPGWDALFDSLKRQRLMRDLDSREACNLVGDLLYGTVIAHRLSGTRRSLTERGGMIIDVVFHGMLIDKGKTRKPAGDADEP